MNEELIPQVSAVIVVGIATSLIAYYGSLCKRVKEFMDKQKEEFAEKFSEWLKTDLAKLALDNQPPTPDWLDKLKEFWRKSQLQAIEMQENTLFQAYDTRRSLEGMRNALSLTIISSVLAIWLSFSVYSSYAIYSLVFASLFLLYGFYLFVKVSNIFLD
jgi:hypothetical protein